MITLDNNRNNNKRLPLYQRQKNRKKERKKGRETERQKDRKTERQKDRKTERQKDRKTERQKDRKTERQKDRETEIMQLLLSFTFCNHISLAQSDHIKRRLM